MLLLSVKKIIFSDSIFANNSNGAMSLLEKPGLLVFKVTLFIGPSSVQRQYYSS